MSILDLARADMQFITTDTSSGFAVTITFTSATGTIATIAGLHTKHREQYDNDGRPINSKKVHISFSEVVLNAAGYITRPGGPTTDVDMKGALATVADATGISKQYIIEQWWPDDTLGLIVCMLGDYEA